MSRWFRLALDGTVTELPSGKLSLDAMQQEVDGWVERVQLDGSTFVWCNEEGVLRGMNVNTVACAIVREFHPYLTIVGPALVEFVRAKPTKRAAPILGALTKASLKVQPNPPTIDSPEERAIFTAALGG